MAWRDRAPRSASSRRPGGRTAWAPASRCWRTRCGRSTASGSPIRSWPPARAGASSALGMPRAPSCTTRRCPRPTSPARRLRWGSCGRISATCSRSTRQRAARRSRSRRRSSTSSSATAPSASPSPTATPARTTCSSRPTAPTRGPARCSSARTARPVYSGQGVWRYTIPRPADVNGLTLHRTRDGAVVGALPLSEDDCYLFYLENTAEHVHMPPDRLGELLRERLAPFSAPMIRDAVEGMDASRHISFRPIDHVLLPAPWHQGRVVLLGDAAHALTPQLTSGGGMAIEDAVVLCEELARPRGRRGRARRVRHAARRARPADLRALARHLQGGAGPGDPRRADRGDHDERLRAAGAAVLRRRAGAAAGGPHAAAQLGGPIQSEAGLNTPLPSYLNTFIWSLQIAGASGYSPHCTVGGPAPAAP